MKLGKITAWVVTGALALTCASGIAPLRVSADISKKERNMYDYEFFGKYESDEWTTQPKLDYAAFPDLCDVESAAKNGDYSAAKTALLSYYRNLGPRRERTDDLPNLPDINETEMELFFEGILTYGNTPLASAVFTNTPSKVSYDITDLVTTRLANNNSTVSVSILARNKEEARVSINARESGENAAVLSIIANGVQYNFDVKRDISIKGGSLSGENFGFENYLYVQDSGWPADDDASRAFFLFDMGELNSSSRITSAQLTVFGSTDAASGSQETMLFKSEQQDWDEGGKTWSNSGLYTFSWQNNFYEKFSYTRPEGNYPDWSICVHRFYFLGGLSTYYRNTGNEKYAKEAIKFLLEYIDKCGAGQRLMEESDRDAGLLIAVGMRMQAFPEILYRLINSPNMTADAFCEIMKYVYDEMDFLYQEETFEGTWTKDTNFGVEELSGQLTVLDAFREFSDINTWMARISDRVDYQIATSDTPLIQNDGSYIESTNSYSATVYKKYLEFKKVFDNLNYPISDSYERQIKRMAYFFTNIAAPNYYFTPFGDCPYMDQSETLENIADEVGRVYADDYLMYLGNKREKGKAPTYTSVSYPDGKVFVQRTGWQEDDLFLFTNTRTNAVHGHNDDLHVNVYAYGSQLLTDNPVYNYDENTANTWMRYRKQGHSTVEIDNGAGTYDVGAEGTQISNTLADLFDGYTKGTVAAKGCRTQHDRQIMFVKPLGFWIVSDVAQIDGPPTGEHTVTQQWQPQINSELSIDSSTKSGKTHYSDGANILIVPADPEALTASVESGYYSLQSKDYLMYKKDMEGTGAVTFDTLLFPVRKGDNNASATVARISTGKTTDLESALRIKTNDVAGNSDGYFFTSRENADKYTFDRFVTDAPTVYISLSERGGVSVLNMYGGKYVAVGTDDFVRLSAATDDFSVYVDGETLYISSSNDSEEYFKGTKIKADAITKIYFNGRAATASFDGAFVTMGEETATVLAASVPVTTQNGTLGLSVSGNVGATLPFEKVTPVSATAQRLCDGRLDTVYTAEGEYPQSVTFDLGEAKPLEKWRFTGKSRRTDRKSGAMILRFR